MKNPLKWKVFLLAFMIIFSSMAVAPSFYTVPAWWQKYFAPEGMRLGLDLQGGMHLVLRVNLEKAVQNALEFAAQDLKDTLADQQISLVRTKSDDPKQVIFTLPNTRALTTVQEVASDDFPNLVINIKAEEGAFPRITLTLNKERIEFINQNAVNQSLEIIRNRIDQFGVAEPVIIRQGIDEIIVQLPGVKDPKRAMQLIGQTAQLKFKLVDHAVAVILPELINNTIAAGLWREGEPREKLNIALQGQLPPETAIYFEQEIDPTTGRIQSIPLLIQNRILMTGAMVKDAQMKIGGNFNEPFVSLDLTSRGGKVFGDITEANVNRRLAIILDDVVRSAPVIRERILGGSAQISGNFTHDEATDLAIILRVGALPAPVEIIQNLTVGASLGKDSINQGLMSGLLGTVLVLIFMVVYFRLSGVIANLALMFNVLLLFTALALLSATLTLPGIAGIILAIGMAVDSNVLIFERMREEFALGKTVKSGIEGGYNNAFSTIIDSQVTTLITAMALFLFGTGPIKGFAITLSLGVTLNLFTTLFATRLIYDVLYRKKLLKPIVFRQFFRKPMFDYIKLRNISFTISTVLVIIGMIAFVQIWRGEANMGVDFAGGSLLQYKAEQPFELKDVRQVFNKTELAGATLQSVGKENRLIVRLKQEDVVGQLGVKVTAILNEHMPGKQFVMESESEIGSSVSAVLRNKAVQAVFIALLGVVGYLALRFDLRFGLAAATATFHDVLVVLGLSYLLGIEITLLVVTALLTLAGYSLNDSVVVFDRIRENIKKMKGSPFNTIINSSVNDVLGRTVVTTLTTAMVLCALFFLGGSVIHDFALVLLMGLIVGTYSSIFVASPLLYVWHKKAETK